MTEEDKDILIAKMLDTPSALTDEELSLISHDDELREIYEVSAAVDSALANLPAIDTDKEWALLQPRLKRRPSAWRWVRRVAAIWIGITAASFFGVRIIDRIMTSGDAPLAAEVAPPCDSILYISMPAEPLQLASFNPAGESPNQHSARSDSFEPGSIDVQEEELEMDDIDIDEYLRVQQARIDNDLALLEAAEINNEYLALSPMLDMIGVDDEAIKETVKQLTLQ